MRLPLLLSPNYLGYHVYPVVQLLSLEEGVDVVEEDQELAQPVPERYDEGYMVTRQAGLRSPLSPSHHGGVSPDELR